jgi:hypothetical protein
MRIVREGISIGVGQIASALGTLVGIRLLTEFMQPTTFGYLSLLMGVAVFAQGFSTTPLMQSILRFYPTCASNGTTGYLRRISMRVLLRTCAAVGAILLVGWYFWRARYGGSVWTGAILAVMLMVDGLRGLEITLLNAARRQSAMALWIALEAWLRPVAAVLLVLWLGESAESVLVGYLCASLGLFLLFRLVLDKVPDFAERSKATVPIHETDLANRMARYALPLVPLAFVGWISAQADRYLIGGMIDLAAVGIYSAMYGLVSRPFLLTGTTVELTLRPVLYQAIADAIGREIETVIAGDHRAALTEAGALLEAGADAPVLIKDLMDAVTEVSRAQALKDAYVYAGPPEWAKRTRVMAEKLSPAQAARMWRLLLQGFEDCARAPDPPAAAQMVVLRLAAAASLPPPEDAMKLLAAGGAVPAPKSQSERRASDPARSAPADASTAAAEDSPHDVEPHHGVRMASLREILDQLESQRKIELRYDIERYVRPAEIDFGHFNYTAAPGAPRDLSLKIKLWLEETSGVEWEVMQSNEGAAESTSERRTRRGRERLKAAEAHPRIAEALKAFPGARVLRVDEPQAQDELEDQPGKANVIHVDFARERVEGEVLPEPEAIPDEEREDDN